MSVGRDKPKTTKPRAPQRVVEKIREALRVARMESARFGREPIYTDDGTVHTVDKFVKEQTRLYRETWLIPPLEDALAWAEGEALTHDYRREK